MTLLLALLLASCFLAYSNGANDNFKGVATLFGSGISNYRYAIWWATISTFIGSICSIFLAESLLKRFSGKGLVSDLIENSPEFLLAVALSAGVTVLLATLTGFPISTTHSLTGALVGSGLVAVGLNINFSILGGKFFLPLLISPLIAIILSAIFYMLFKKMMIYKKGQEERFLNLSENPKSIADHERSFSLSPQKVNTEKNKKDYFNQAHFEKDIRYTNNRTINFAHYISAGIVSFARGLNDTPKIVALLLVIQQLDIRLGMLIVAIFIATGGLLNAKKVAYTMSKKITTLDHEQGFIANIVTGMLVVFASRFGLPVSTTHVSVGSLLGIALVNRNGNKRIIYEILLSWIFTLPIALILGILFYWLLTL
jgi:PiT family inorganic phosphate transporter